MKLSMEHLTKIEGHANLNLEINEDKVEKVEMNIFESSRFFESIVLGKHFSRVWELTSRICGICSVSHCLASIMALENGMNVNVSDQTVTLRKLLTYGEFIQSHLVHSHFNSLPAYLKTGGIIELASKDKTLVRNALKIKEAGNEIIKAIGGRAVHPLACTIGGFSKFPDKKSIENLKTVLKGVKPLALESLEKFSKLDYESFNLDKDHFCLVNRDYTLLSGVSKSLKTPLVFGNEEFEKVIKEKKRSYSTAKFAEIDSKPFMVGALPRVNINGKRLSESVKPYVFPVSFNPFLNDYAQVIELVHCIDESLNLLENLDVKEEKVRFKPRAGIGFSATEAPRGTLFHKYKINGKGIVTNANIITPTAQNLPVIESAVREYLPNIMHLKKEEIVKKLESLIRAFDPCISCSTHFLRIKGL